MTIAPAGLAPRRCHLRDSDHRYVNEVTGEEMGISVTGVTSFFKPPYDGPPEAAWRGTHVHRLMYFKATGELPPGCDHLGTHSPEGIDCTDWIQQLGSMSFWDQIETLGAEFTMINSSESVFLYRCVLNRTFTASLCIKPNLRYVSQRTHSCVYALMT